MKICSVCKEEKPDTEFYSCNKTSTCKSCYAVKRKEYYDKNKGKISEKAIKWNKENKERRKETTKRWRENHKEYVLEYRRKWREENRERVRSNARILRYGLTPEMFDYLMEIQNYKCAICGVELDMDKLHVDHNHETDEVRGILCRKCNVGLGQFSDSPDTLLKAAEYVENNGLNNLIEAKAREFSRND